MRDCCSNQEETIGEIFTIIVENYKVVSIVAIFAVVIIIKFYFIDIKKTKKD